MQFAQNRHRAIKYPELKRMYDLSPEQTCKHLREALQVGALKPMDFSIREVAEATLGEGRVKDMDPRHGGGFAVLREAGDGVDVTAFSNITGQIAFSAILQAYENEEFLLSRKIPNVPTRLDGEKIPGIEKLSDVAAIVQPGMPYPSAGFGEDYIETPATTKRGFIVPVTREAIFFDRTNLIVQRAGDVGELLGLNKEKRLIDILTGATNNYKRKGTESNTYQAATPWINTLTDALVDWTDVDAVEQLFADMLDPNTGEPILIGAKEVISVPALTHTLNRVFNAIGIDYQEGGQAGTVPTTTRASNPLTGYTWDVSRLVYRQLVTNGTAADLTAAAKYWFVGNFARAFAYMENWPITVVQAPPNSEPEFTQDIVLRFKASERGVAAVMEPRYVVRSTGAG